MRHHALMIAFGPEAVPDYLKKCDKSPNEKVSEVLFSGDAEVANQYLADTKKNYSLLFEDSYQNNIERVIFYVELYNKKHPR